MQQFRAKDYLCLFRVCRCRRAGRSSGEQTVQRWRRKMFCLAGIGGRVSGIVKATEAAQSILAIDDGPLDCTRKTLELAGVAEITHLRLSDLGFEKGVTEVSASAIAGVIEQAKVYL